MLLFGVTKYLLFDYALNTFFNKVDESMTVYLDINEIQVGMWFEEIIFTEIFTVRYLKCKIEQVRINDDGGGQIIFTFGVIRDFYMSKESKVLGRQVAIKPFQKILKFTPGKALHIRNNNIWTSITPSGYKIEMKVIKSRL